MGETLLGTADRNRLIAEIKIDIHWVYSFDYGIPSSHLNLHFHINIGDNHGRRFNGRG